MEDIKSKWVESFSKQKWGKSCDISQEGKWGKRKEMKGVLTRSYSKS